MKFLCSNHRPFNDPFIGISRARLEKCVGREVKQVCYCKRSAINNSSI